MSRDESRIPTETDVDKLPADLPSDSTLSYNPGRTLEFWKEESSSQTATIWESGVPSRWFVTEIDTTAAAAPPEREDETGRPAYQLHRVIGRGGFGEVWEATQGSLDRTIAIKRLREDRHREAMEDPSSSRQFHIVFQQEALTTAHLEHPNIVPIYDLGEDEEGRPLLAMKLVRGTPWNEMLAQDSNMAMAPYLAKHLPILIDVAQAVAFAHSRGVLHRDLKPPQVMVGEFGEVLLMDWGLALIFDEEKAGLSGQEAPRAFAPTIADATSPSGTAAFMAPEQTETSARNVGPWTDVYLLGGTLFYILTQTLPHNGGSAREAFLQAMMGDVEPASRRAPDRDIPAELTDLCSRALEPDRRQRIASAQEFVQELRDYLSGETRRREALAIIANVKDAIEREPNTYRELAELDNQLVRALGLWEDNAEARQLRQWVIADHARLALQNGDLVLARVLAERLEAEPRRGELLQKVEAAEQEARRNRRQRAVLLRAAAVMLLALGVLGAFAYRRSVVAQEERDRAEANAQQARHALELATQQQKLAEERRAEAETQRDLAQRSRGRAEDLLGFMLGDLHDQLKPLNRLDMLGGVAEASMNYFGSYGAEEMDAEVYLQQAVALQRLARILHDGGDLQPAGEALQRAQDSLERAQLADPALHDVRLELGRVYQMQAALEEARGRIGASLEKIEAANTIFRNAPEDAANPLDWKTEEAASNRDWADYLHAAGRIEEAIEKSNAAIEISNGLALEFPENVELAKQSAVSLHRSSSILLESGRQERALDVERQAREILTEISTGEGLTPDLTSLLANVNSRSAVLLVQSGDVASALERSREAVELLRPLAESDPANLTWQYQYGELALQYGTLLERTGDYSAAEQSFLEGIAAGEILTERDPESTEWAFMLARGEEYLGDLLMKMGRTLEALDREMKALELRRVVAERDPENLDYQRHLAASLNTTAVTLKELDRDEEALALQLESLELRKQLGAADPANLEWQRDIAVSLNNLGTIYKALEDIDSANEQYNKAVELLRQLSHEWPQNITIRGDLVMMLNNVADTRIQNGEIEVSIAMFEEAITQVKELRELDSGNVTWGFLHGRLNENAGSLLNELERYEEALPYLRRAEDLFLDLGASAPSAQVQSSLVNSQALLAQATYYVEGVDAAMEPRLRAFESAGKLIEQAPDEPFHQYLYVDNGYLAGWYAGGTGEFERAAELLETVQAHSLELVKRGGILAELGGQYVMQTAERLSMIYLEKEELEAALEQMTLAVENGYEDADALAGEDFAELREAYPAEVEELVSRIESAGEGESGGGE